MVGPRQQPKTALKLYCYCIGNSSVTSNNDEMMDSDDDDIYPEHGEARAHQNQGDFRMQDAEDGEEEGEEVEEDDSDVCIP